MAKQYSGGNQRDGMGFIMIAVIVIVIILGVIAVYKSISTTKKKDKLDNYNATITERADTLGMEADEFLALYGLSDSGLKGSDSEQDAYDKMTLANYVKYSSGTELPEADLDDFKKAMGDQLGDAEVTLDTTDMNVKAMYSSYAQQKQEEEQAAQQAAQEEPAAAGVDTDGAETAVEK